MEKWYGIPKEAILELAKEADEMYPVPIEANRIISRPFVLTTGKKWFVGTLRLEYDVIAGWIPLFHDSLSDYYTTKYDAINVYMEIVNPEEYDGIS